MKFNYDTGLEQINTLLIETGLFSPEAISAILSYCNWYTNKCERFFNDNGKNDNRNSAFHQFSHLTFRSKITNPFTLVNFENNVVYDFLFELVNQEYLEFKESSTNLDIKFDRYCFSEVYYGIFIAKALLFYSLIIQLDSRKQELKEYQSFEKYIGPFISLIHPIIVSQLDINSESCINPYKYESSTIASYAWKDIFKLPLRFTPLFIFSIFYFKFKHIITHPKFTYFILNASSEIYIHIIFPVKTSIYNFRKKHNL